MKTLSIVALVLGFLMFALGCPQAPKQATAPKKTTAAEKEKPATEKERPAPEKQTPAPVQEKAPADKQKPGGKDESLEARPLVKQETKVEKGPIDAERRYRLQEGGRIGEGTVINIDQQDWNLDLPKAGITIGSLTFLKPCKLTIRKADRTLLAVTEGISAKDDRGKLWSSKRAVVEGKEVFAFFEDD